MGTTWSPSLSSDRQTIYEEDVPFDSVFVTMVASPTDWSLYVSTCSFVKLAAYIIFFTCRSVKVSSLRFVFCFGCLIVGRSAIVCSGSTAMG